MTKFRPKKSKIVPKNKNSDPKIQNTQNPKFPKNKVWRAPKIPKKQTLEMCPVFQLGKQRAHFQTFVCCRAGAEHRSPNTNKRSGRTRSPNMFRWRWAEQTFRPKLLRSNKHKLNQKHDPNKRSDNPNTFTRTRSDSNAEENTEHEQTFSEHRTLFRSSPV